MAESLEHKFIPATLKITTMQNKDGHAYQMLLIFVEHNNELLLVHKVYMKETLKAVFNHLLNS
jgi:hypothetical protein